MPNGEVENT